MFLIVMFVFVGLFMVLVLMILNLISDLVVVVEIGCDKDVCKVNSGCVCIFDLIVWFDEIGCFSGVLCGMVGVFYECIDGNE